MVSNNSHPIFTEVANGQIEKGWGELQSIGRKWTLGLNNQRPLKGLQYINAPFPSVVVQHSAMLSSLIWLIITWEICRVKACISSLKMTFPERAEKVIKLSKAFHANDDQQPEAQSYSHSSGISLIFFLPLLCTTLTQNWNEHANAQLWTNNKCVPAPPVTIF